MDIKEIALRLLAKEFPGMHQENQAFMVEFAEALIESYKAELLKEVTSKDVLGEPVAYFSDEFFSINTKQNATFNDPLFSSDQVVAAILKATKPMEHELRELRMAKRMRGEDIDELRTQLAAAQEANEHWQRATAENENKWIEANDKLAKAEQRVAEAISAMCNKSIAPWEQRRHGRTEAEDKVIEIIEGIEAGEWRKFVKEV